MDVKRLTLAFLLFILLAGNISLLTSPCVRGGVEVSPAKLYIDIEEYPLKEIHYKVKVDNPFPYDIKASTKVINPFKLYENYTRIPNLSWIKIIPEKLVVPGNSYKEFEVILDVPEKEKTLHYNESWEAWVIVEPRSTSGSEKGSITIQLQLAVKLLIHNPSGRMKTQTPLAIYLIIGIIGGFVILLTFFSILKKKQTINVNKTAVFYFKDKERKNHEKK